jgi:hypothetical protein
VWVFFAENTAFRFAGGWAVSAHRGGLLLRVMVLYGEMREREMQVSIALLLR